MREVRDITEIRAGFDVVYDGFLDGLCEWAALTDEIGQVKAANGLPIVHEDRRVEVRGKLMAEAGARGMSPEHVNFVGQFYDFMHESGVFCKWA